MIDFACKRFDLMEIIKCGLGLTKAELKIMTYFLDSIGKEYTTNDLSKKLELKLTTIQKGVKKLSEKKIILRHQKNLDNGGYIYVYETNSKDKIKKIIKDIIRNWSKKVEDRIDDL